MIDMSDRSYVDMRLGPLKLGLRHLPVLPWFFGCYLFKMEPTTGIEPVNLFLTKEALYRLSYVGQSN